MAETLPIPSGLRGSSGNSCFRVSGFPLNIVSSSQEPAQKNSPKLINSQSCNLYILCSTEYYIILLMNNFTIFSSFFQGKALLFLERIIDLALEEDGQDLTSNAVFSQESNAQAVILAKESCIIAGLPISELILARLPGSTEVSFLATEGIRAEPGQRIISIEGSTRKILKAERIILNLLSRLSGIATHTDLYCQKLKGTGVRLLDTRKTSPGLRYPEKYAVLLGGGENHRLNLENMLMLKDNHIDQCGSITKAVKALRQTYSPCPDIEVECRTPQDVEEAVKTKVQRIMLDNMSMKQLEKSLSLIPSSIESEISGCITLDNIEKIASLKPDFVSSGALTHSAKHIDMSMKIEV